MKSDLLKKFSSIKIFLFDLEGVLMPVEYDGKDEQEKKILGSISNGCNKFRSLGVKFGIVTARSDKLISKIHREVKCSLLSASIDKVSMVDELLREKNIGYGEVFYMGDDVLDIPLLQRVGLSAAPKDGRREVKRMVSFIAKSNSGEVLQEIIDYLIESKRMN